MSASLNMRKLFLTIALIVGLIAVAVPACQMAVCTVSADGTMTSSVPMISGVCNAMGMTSTAPVGSLPPSSQSLILALAIVVGVATLLVSPPLDSSRLLVVAEDPPAPPEDPRGVRLLL